MIEVVLDVSGFTQAFGVGDKLSLFFVDAPKTCSEEVRQAIAGEINYNGAMYEFGGLIYEAS